MRIFGYVLLSIVVLVIGFFVWFFMCFLQVPELNIPKDASDTTKIEYYNNWFTELQSQGKFNGGVLFIKNNQSVFAKTYGFADVGKLEELTNYSSFRLASLSKQFTASGIMLLHENGKLNYDDLVTTYIKDFPYTNVTVRHLLNQTSGIPDVYMQLAKKQSDNIDVLTNEIAVQLIIDNKPKSNFSPNEKYVYSNTNYVVLARIIELISNQSFEDYMKRNVFLPLKMKNTRVWNLVSKEKNFEAKVEDFEDFAGKARKLDTSFIDGVAGDGAVFSSVNDFIIWNSFWDKNNLISDCNLKEAFKRPKLNNGTLSNYGFGWVLLNDNITMHNGKWLGANTYYIRNTETKSAFVLLDNSSNIFFDKIIEALTAN